MGRSILKFSAEVVPRCPFGPKTAKKWKTPPPKCVTFDFTLIGGGAGAPRQKVKVGNCPKSWVKILRTTVGRRGWGRRHENGAFDTEIFR